MVDTFTRLFGPYPFDGYTVVVTDDDLEIPLEAQGLSTFGANFLTSDWDSVRLVAHELSHQWFGNSLTLGRWQDIWLHEGFACYAEWLWSEESGGPTAHERAQAAPRRGSGELDQDLRARRPRAGADVRRPRLQARRADPARGAAHGRATTRSSTCCAAGPPKHAHGTVNTGAFVEFAELPPGPTSPASSTPGSTARRSRTCPTHR